MKPLRLILSFVLLIGCACTSSDPSHSIGEAWNQNNSLSFDGRTRTYSVYAPAEGEIRGLIVVLHGAGDSVENMISEIAVETTADQNGVVVAVPAGVDNGWNDEDPPGGDLADDVGFIDALVRELKVAYPSLPSDKIFVHGFSNGGGLATRLACESSQIRGVGVIGNYYMSVGGECPRPTGEEIPGWFGAGVDDGLVLVETVREAMSDYAADLTDCTRTGSLETVEVAGMADGVLCKQLSDCDAVRLCEYADRGHEVLPDSIAAAWRFLSDAVDAKSD